MAKKNETKAAVKTAEEKKVTKINLEELSLSVETHFTKNEVVDVIADSRLERPTALTYDDFKFVHFYKKGTNKDLFQAYLGKTTTFIIRTTVAEFLADDITTRPIHKKIKGEDKVIHIEVKCPIDTINEVAEKIIEAYGKRDTQVTNTVDKPKKTKKKVEPETQA